MADRIDFKLSVTPIIGLAEDAQGAGGAEVLSADIKGTIGGGNSSLTWAGNDIAGWDMSSGTPANRIHVHITANGGTVVSSSSNGVFIKNTGFDFDAAEDNKVGTTTVAEDNSVTVTVTAGGVVIAKLAGGEAIFFPNPADTTFTLGVSSGTDYPAVQYAILD